MNQLSHTDIFRFVCILLNLEESEIIDIFSKGKIDLNYGDLRARLAENTDEGFQALTDLEMSVFLNGLIEFKRGPSQTKSSSKQTTTDEPLDLSYNDILKKLRIAFNLKEKDMISIFELGLLELSPSELKAFSRSPDNKHYRKLNSEYLICFLNGLELYQET